MWRVKLRTFIGNLQTRQLNILLTAFFGILAGLSINRFLPVFSENTYFLIAIPFILIFFILMFVNARAALIILLFSRALLDPFMNTTKIAVLGESFGIGGVLNLVIIIFTLILMFKDGWTSTRNNSVRPWIIFLLICFLTTIYSPVQTKALKLFINLVSYFCMFILPFYLVKTTIDKKLWIKIIIFSSFLPVLFANLDLLRGGHFYEDAGIRISGTFSHPNILAFYLVLIIAVVFLVLKTEMFNLNKLKSNFLRLYVLNLLILLLATKTRSAWISCWCIFFIFGLLKDKKYLLLMIILPLFFMLIPGVRDRVQDIFASKYNEAGRLNSLAWRLKLWQSSMASIKENLFFGHGLASFERLSESFFVMDKGLSKGAPAHNAYLGILFETGIIGLLSYLFIFFAILKKISLKLSIILKKTSFEYAIIFSYVLSYMVSSFSDNMLYYLAFNWYFWFFIGIMLKDTLIEEEK
jgi:O-antigen ligase